MPNLVPTVIEKTHNGERAYDIYSRLLKDRIIMLDTEVSSHSANRISRFSAGVSSDQFSGFCIFFNPFRFTYRHRIP